MFPNYEGLSDLDRIAKCIEFELSHGGNNIAAARAVLRDIERGYILPHLTRRTMDEVQECDCNSAFGFHEVSCAQTWRIK